MSPTGLYMRLAELRNVSPSSARCCLAPARRLALALTDCPCPPLVTLLDSINRYVDADGSATEVYPANPNGSPLGIAAMCSEDG